jgi:hypothetical protein
MKVTRSQIRKLLESYEYSDTSPMTHAEKKAHMSILQIVKNSVLSKMMNDEQDTGESKHGKVIAYIPESVWVLVENRRKVMGKISSFMSVNNLVGVWIDVHNIKISW